MIRVYTDFNARDPSGVAYILMIGEGMSKMDLSENLSDLGILIGDRVLLCQYEVEVEAVLYIQFVVMAGKNMLVAIPDWDTSVDQ
jgi:hypothetical protein